MLSNLTRKNQILDIPGLLLKKFETNVKTKEIFPASFTINGQDIDDKYDIANQFNSFFASVGANISGGIINNGSKTFSSYLKQRIECSFQFECVDVSDGKKVIQNLASKNSSGHDVISTRFLKKILEIITPPLTHIINQSLCTGIFPDRLKIAKVIPLFKKGDQHVLDNYRPISLLPVISKVFEKLCSTNYISISLTTISFTTASTVLEAYIPRNLRP